MLCSGISIDCPHGIYAPKCGLETSFASTKVMARCELAGRVGADGQRRTVWKKVQSFGLRWNRFEINPECNPRVCSTFGKRREPVARFSAPHTMARPNRDQNKKREAILGQCLCGLVVGFGFGVDPNVIVFDFDVVSIDFQTWIVGPLSAAQFETPSMPRTGDLVPST